MPFQYRMKYPDNNGEMHYSQWSNDIFAVADMVTKCNIHWPTIKHSMDMQEVEQIKQTISDKLKQAAEYPINPDRRILQDVPELLQQRRFAALEALDTQDEKIKEKRIKEVERSNQELKRIFCI